MIKILIMLYLTFAQAWLIVFHFTGELSSFINSMLWILATLLVLIIDIKGENNA